MTFLLFLIFIIAIGCAGFFLVYKSDQNITSLQKDNHLLKKQLANIKDKYAFLDSSNKDYNIEFLTVDNRYGLLPKGTVLHLSPDDNSYVLQRTNIGMQVAIFEKALSNNSTWYYVALPTDSNINCRGWVNESNFSDISSTPVELYEEKK